MNLTSHRLPLILSSAERLSSNTRTAFVVDLKLPVAIKVFYNKIACSKLCRRAFSETRDGDQAAGLMCIGGSRINLTFL